VNRECLHGSRAASVFLKIDGCPGEVFLENIRIGILLDKLEEYYFNRYSLVRFYENTLDALAIFLYSHTT
jgi:hypothetical protein